MPCLKIYYTSLIYNMLFTLIYPYVYLLVSYVYSTKRRYVHTVTLLR